MTSATAASADTTSSQTPVYGRFVWYDLITTDVSAATAFYTKIAGWGTQEFDMGPAGMYQMWTVDGQMIGGVTKLSPDMGEGTPPHWMASVGVASVDETAGQAESLGGKVVMPPTEIPDVGRYAIISDPQGAMIALYTSLQGAPQGEFAPRVGEFSWHELMTTDYKAALAFYSQLFGWEELTAMDMGPTVGMYSMYGHRTHGAKPYGGIFTMSPEMRAHMPAAWVYYIRVKSADSATEMVTSLGGKVLNGPMEVPGGDRISQVMDPQGGMFALHSTKA